MRFETFHLLSNPAMESGTDVYANAMEQICLADSADFATAWFAEHHFSNYGYCPNPFLPIVKAAGMTERIRFGQAVSVLPLWHPVRLVEDINVTDTLCDGRLEVGFGRGYQPAEFAALGAELDDSQARFDEALALITKAWTEEDFTFEGRFWQVPRPLTILPKPVQAPHPPLLIAASSPNTFVRAARDGVGVLSSGIGLTLDAVGEARARFGNALDELGTSSSNREFHSLRFVHVAPTDEEAAAHIPSTRWNGRVAAASHVSDEHVVAGRAAEIAGDDELSDAEWSERLVFGSPETVIRRLRKLEDAGVTHVICHFDFGRVTNREALASMELFAEAVMPAFASELVHAD